MSNRYLEVEDHKELVKDTLTNSILNADVDAFKQFKAKKAKEQAIENKFKSLDVKISGIYEMLKTLTENK